MNSSSMDNKVSLSKDKELKPKAEPEVIIEYEPEPDDYNYEPPATEVDEEELRQLQWTGQKTSNSKVMMAVAAIAVAAIIGFIVGMVYGGIAQSKNDEKRKSTIAQTVQRQYDNKLKNFEEFSKMFDKFAGSTYEKSEFDSAMAKLQKIDYMLDMSSEVSAEVILLNDDPRANPVKNLREYSANTMLLVQLLSIHRNETTADEEEIQALIEKQNASDTVYAMRFNSGAAYYLALDAPREQFANGVDGIFTLREAITDDTDLVSSYNAYASDNSWGNMQHSDRDYKPANKAEEKALEGKVLPNRIMYDILDRRGASHLVFADEIVLVDRQLLFGKSLNALERYKQRTDQIKALISSTNEVASSISGDLGKFL